MKYNVFNNHIINVTTTEINTCKKIFKFGQRDVISFFSLVINKGEHSIIHSKKTNIDWKRDTKKESNTVKGA